MVWYRHPEPELIDVPRMRTLRTFAGESPAEENPWCGAQRRDRYGHVVATCSFRVSHMKENPAHRDIHTRATWEGDLDNVVALPPPLPQNLTCECGSEWWSASVVVDARERRVVGYALPLRCTECGSESSMP